MGAWVSGTGAAASGTGVMGWASDTTRPVAAAAKPRDRVCRVMKFSVPRSSSGPPAAPVGRRLRVLHGGLSGHAPEPRSHSNAAE